MTFFLVKGTVKLLSYIVQWGGLWQTSLFMDIRNGKEKYCTFKQLIPPAALQNRDPECWVSWASPKAFLPPVLVQKMAGLPDVWKGFRNFFSYKQYLFIYWFRFQARVGSSTLFSTVQCLTYTDSYDLHRILYRLWTLNFTRKLHTKWTIYDSKRSVVSKSTEKKKF